MQGFSGSQHCMYHAFTCVNAGRTSMRDALMLRCVVAYDACAGCLGQGGRGRGRLVHWTTVRGRSGTVSRERERERKGGSP